MKRITYISKIAGELTEEQLTKLGEESEERNAKNNITGVLAYTGGLFYQIIEGEDVVIDSLYNGIMKDKRHKEVVCLKTEYNISKRLFPDFSMKLINLDNSSDELILALNSLLQNLTESHGIISHYT